MSNHISAFDIQCRLCIGAWSAIGIGLTCATWPLWWPGTSSFPTVPFFELGATQLIRQLLACGLVIGFLISLGGAIRKQDRVVGLGALGFTSCGTFLVLGNIHRLQPWMYHFLVLGLVVAIDSFARPQRLDTADSVEEANPNRQRASGVRVFQSQTGLLILLTSSIYIWSGISKLDAEFSNSYGQQFCSILLKPVGINVALWSVKLKQILALSLPAGELLIGMLLLLTRTRITGFMLSFVMHASLLYIVGPFGLNHETGVLLWNVYFIVQNAILLSCERRSGIHSNGISTRQEASTIMKPLVTRTRKASRASVVIVSVVAVLPIARGLGYLDNWPAWAVYSASTSRVYPQIKADSVPDDFVAKPFLEEPRIQNGWLNLRLDQWSLASCQAPIYPQDRFSIAICRGLLKEYPRMQMRIVVESEADRWSGQRTSQVLDSREAIDEFASRYILRVDSDMETKR